VRAGAVARGTRLFLALEPHAVRRLDAPAAGRVVPVVAVGRDAADDGGFDLDAAVGAREARRVGHDDPELGREVGRTLAVRDAALRAAADPADRRPDPGIGRG